MSSAPGPVSERPPGFRHLSVLIHLGLTLIVLGLLALVILDWFPGYLFVADGGWQALFLLSGTALVLGPMLTWLVANPAKPRHLLWLDLSLIAGLQLLALAAGAWLIREQRPCAVFWVDGTLYSRPWSAFADEPAARQRIAQLTEQQPAWIAIDMPADPFAREPLIRNALRNRSSVEFNASLYIPFSTTLPQVRAAARKLAGKPLPPDLAAGLAAAGIAPETLREGRLLLLPARSRYGNGHLVLEPETGRVVFRLFP
ncbi:MAG: hypothetical protein ACOY33_01835 [Pseudomonadota bacterium]